MLDVGEDVASRHVYTIKDDDEPRPVFRAVRYLSPAFVLALSNLPDNSGALLHVFRLPTTPTASATLAISRRVSKKGKALRLAVSNLSPSNPQADTQYVVAVANNDASISLLALEHRSAAKIDYFPSLSAVTTLGAGDLQISDLAFSPPPSVPPKGNAAREVRLASIALERTVVVHHPPAQALRRRRCTPAQGRAAEDAALCACAPVKDGSARAAHGGGVGHGSHHGHHGADAA